LQALFFVPAQPEEVVTIGSESAGCGANAQTKRAFVTRRRLSVEDLLFAKKADFTPASRNRRVPERRIRDFVFEATLCGHTILRG